MLTGFIFLISALLCFYGGIVTAIVLDSRSLRKAKNGYSINKDVLSNIGQNNRNLEKENSSLKIQLSMADNKIDNKSKITLSEDHV
jgi:hypothetical protein